MNSALKPVLASAGVPQPTGQSSPAKGNVASVNHASVGHPQGAQNSLNHANTSNNLAVQNLTQHVPAPQAPPHAVPSMAPVSANMAQMAQNMSNHGNLSHVNQNTGPPVPAAAASPNKAPSTSSPLSLVAEKANASQPLALTRSPEKPEKKEPDSTGQANGTVDSPKSASNAPVTLKAQNTEANKDKQDIAKTSPSTTKPPEKPSTLPTTQKTESTNPAVPGDVPTQPKAATASEPTATSPSKPAETKPTPMADVAPAQSDSKPVPESASKSEPCPLEKEKTPAPANPDPPAESPKPEPVKVEEKKEVAPEKPSTEEKPKETEVKEKQEPPKKEDTVDAPVKVAEKEKVEPKKEIKPKSTLKLATVTTPLRKRRQVSPVKGSDGPSPAKKAADGESTPADARTKRNRTKVQLYQSPTPELAMATKLSASAGRSTPTKPNDDKLIVFYKNEYLAVRNAEGGFYVCQTMQNVYRTTRKIKIRWLSQDKQADPSGETYKPDFYDVTDMECVLTTLSLSRAAGSGGAQVLRAAEQARATSILQRALRADTSPGSLQLTPEHPDGLDLSLYTDESQLEKRARKRAATKTSPRNKGDNTETAKEEVTPVKKARTPKRSPKSTRKAKVTPPQPAPAKTNNNKRKSPGSTPVVASTSKTATAVVEKAKAAAKPTPKRTPAKPKPEPVVTPLRKGRRTAAKEAKPAAAQPSPSGKAGRTPRKPPARK